MPLATGRKYSFTSSSLAEDTFAVVDFSGEEGLSQPYRFDITLVTDTPEINLESVIHNRARFTIHRETGEDIYFSGILTSIEERHAVDVFVFYRAVLVPRLWWLSFTHHNQVFLGNTVQEMVTHVLTDGGLTPLDFEFRLQGDYAPHPYACQYNESHYNFISRWLAREGIYFFFEQTSDGDKIIFTDTAIAHKESRHGKKLYYAPPSGLGDAHREESISGFICRRNTLPGKVLLKDYNYERPSLEITGTADVDSQGKGEIYTYGNHFRTTEEGNRLAKILAQALLCRKTEYIGESTTPYVQPGFTFSLENHHRSGFNQNYLTVEMHHEGSQTGYLAAGIQKGFSDREKRVYYANQFTAIPGSVQFRAQRSAAAPKITGTLSAKIDAAGSGKYAELDEQGRYKVTLPFDLSGRKDGKASTWLRMMQPYSGRDHGMHLPLHKGTEVLLTFIEGDPDRPIIAGTAPNPETPSLVTAASQETCRIKTSGGNEIEFVDKEGHERIIIMSPCQKSMVKAGDAVTEKSWLGKLGVDGWSGGISAAIGYEQTAVKAAFELAGVLGDATGLFHIDAAPDKGVQLSSADGLLISAAKKQETFGAITAPGYSISSTTGFRFDSVTGYSKQSVTGMASESIIGKHSRLVVGSSDSSVVGFKQYLAMKKDSIIAAATKVKGAVTKVAEEVTKLAGQVTALFGEQTKVVEEEIEMAEIMTVVDGEETRVVGESSQVTGERTELDGDSTRVAGEETGVSGDKIQMADILTELSADRTQIDGENTTLSGETTAIVGENSQISALTEIL